MLALPFKSSINGSTPGGFYHSNMLFFLLASEFLASSSSSVKAAFEDRVIHLAWLINGLERVEEAMKGGKEFDVIRIIVNTTSAPLQDFRSIASIYFW